MLIMSYEEQFGELLQRVMKLEEALDKVGSIEQFLKRINQIEERLFMTKEVLSLEEASVFLNFSKSQLYKLTRTFAIPHYKPTGKYIYFDRLELLQWIKSQPVKTKMEHQQDAIRYVMDKPLKRK